MTLDDALTLITQKPHCWIVWNTQTGEILSVTGFDSPPSPIDTIRSLQSLKDFGVPAKGRFLDSAQVTREWLQNEVTEVERVRTRIEILTDWDTAPVAELLSILERGDYKQPIAKRDSCILIDHLWELHRDRLTAQVQARLSRLVGRPVLDELASRHLRAYLLALAGDVETLKAIWTHKLPGRTTLGDTFVLMECFAHVHLNDQAIIGDMIAMVAQEGMFGPRYRAMLALSKLGSAAGARAAEVIQAAIYDSEPWIIAVRDRVLQRLRSPDDQWARCHACCDGNIHVPARRGMQSCPICLGLGYIRQIPTP